MISSRRVEKRQVHDDQEVFFLIHNANCLRCKLFWKLFREHVVVFAIGILLLCINCLGNGIVVVRNYGLVILKSEDQGEKINNFKVYQNHCYISYYYLYYLISLVNLCNFSVGMHSNFLFTVQL